MIRTTRINEGSNEIRRHHAKPSICHLRFNKRKNNSLDREVSLATWDDCCHQKYCKQCISNIQIFQILQAVHFKILQAVYFQYSNISNIASSSFQNIASSAFPKYGSVRRWRACRHCGMQRADCLWGNFDKQSQSLVHPRACHRQQEWNGGPCWRNIPRDQRHNSAYEMIDNQAASSFQVCSNHLSSSDSMDGAVSCRCHLYQPTTLSPDGPLPTGRHLSCHNTHLRLYGTFLLM